MRQCIRTKLAILLVTPRFCFVLLTLAFAVRDWLAAVQSQLWCEDVDLELLVARGVFFMTISSCRPEIVTFVFVPE